MLQRTSRASASATCSERLEPQVAGDDQPCFHWIETRRGLHRRRVVFRRGGTGFEKRVRDGAGRTHRFDAFDGRRHEIGQDLMDAMKLRYRCWTSTSSDAVSGGS
jgi:hypothetical protein